MPSPVNVCTFHGLHWSRMLKRQVRLGANMQRRTARPSKQLSTWSCTWRPDRNSSIRYPYCMWSDGRHENGHPAAGFHTASRDDLCLQIQPRYQSLRYSSRVCYLRPLEGRGEQECATIVTVSAVAASLTSVGSAVGWDGALMSQSRYGRPRYAEYVTHQFPCGSPVIPASWAITPSTTSACFIHGIDVWHFTSLI